MSRAEDVLVELVTKYKNIKSNEMVESIEIKNYLEDLKQNDDLLKEYIKDAFSLNENASSMFSAFNQWSSLVGSPTDTEPSDSLIGERYYKSLYLNNRGVLLFLYFYKRFLETYSPNYPNNYGPMRDFQKIRRGFYSQDSTGMWSDLFFYNVLADCLANWVNWNSDPADEIDLAGKGGLNGLSASDNPYIEFIWKFFFDRNMQRSLSELTYEEMEAVMPALFGGFTQCVSRGHNPTKRHPELLKPEFWQKPRRNSDMFANEIITLLNN